MNATAQYHVGTTIHRSGVAFDVEVHFDVRTFLRGYAATHTDPGEGDAFEFHLVGAELLADDEPSLTGAETEALARWLDGDGYDAACEAAEGYAADQAAMMADYRYEGWRDEQMTGGQ